MRILFELTIPGKPVGYYAQGKVPNFERMKAYHAYKAHVQATCKTAGIELPLVASKGQALEIRTVAYFFNGTHADPLNIHKGIGDALFWTPPKTKGGRGKRSGDKHTGGAYAAPLYDSANPRVEIKVYRLDDVADDIEKNEP